MATDLLMPLFPILPVALIGIGAGLVTVSWVMCCIGAFADRQGIVDSSTAVTVTGLALIGVGLFLLFVFEAFHILTKAIT